MVKIEYICAHCGAKNILVKYWRGEDAPDHRIKCNVCGGEISVRQEREAAP